MGGLTDFVPFLGPISDLVGGHLNRKESRAQQDQNDAMQREFAQMGVRWKVEDAKRAGVHPLFALGAQTTGYTPNPVISDSYSEIGRAGQNISDAVTRAGTSQHERLRRNLELEVLRSQAQHSYAEASVAESTNMRMRLAMEQSRALPQSGDHVDAMSSAHVRPLRDNNPYTVGQDLPGEDSFWKRWNVGGSPGGKQFMVDIPFNEEGPSESISETPVWLTPAIVQHNVRQFGTSWLRDLAERWPGAETVLRGMGLYE